MGGGGAGKKERKGREAAGKEEKLREKGARARHLRFKLLAPARGIFFKALSAGPLCGVAAALSWIGIIITTVKG